MILYSPRDGPIVIVDDSETDLMVARRCYDRSHLQRPMVEFTSGEGLLAYLDEVSLGGKPMPALVLLDINMPGMGGFEVLKAIRSRPEFQDIPVIVMLTNSDSPRDIEQATACGANGFQVKPMVVQDYVAFFDSLVG